MNKIAVVSAILDEPAKSQKDFNQLVSDFKGIVKGRLGIPFEREEIAVISIVLVGEIDEINSFTGKLGKLKGVTVKTAVSKKEISQESFHVY